MIAREFSKRQPARQVEARALGVRVEGVGEARHYRTRSQAQPGEVYTLKRAPVGWACSCQGFYHTGIRKHLGQGEHRAERQGWTFGAIAPPSKVARYVPLDQAPEPEPPVPAALPARKSAVAPQAGRESTRRALSELYADAA